MKNFYKIGSLLLVVLLVLTFAACGGDTNSGKDTQTSSSDASTHEETSNDTVSEETVSESTGGSDTESKVLVAYFSATGNTKAVAETIADELGADIFEIMPAEPYTSEDLNWTNSDSRVCREHDDEALRDVELTVAEVENFDDYDTVFIGYPIWWGIAAWPVDNFVKSNDFTGKTVIPFATSASSGIGQSGSLLEAMANGGTWQEGQRFSGSASDNTVRKWVDELGL